jgi:putative lipoic acid-binding regulatory protein
MGFISFKRTGEGICALKIHDRTEKVSIEYPCRWTYKVIGANLEEMRAAIAELMPDGDCIVTLSRSSAGGRYHCLNVDRKVGSEADRVWLYEALRKHPAVRIVL